MILHVASTIKIIAAAAAIARLGIGTTLPGVCFSEIRNHIF